MSSAPPKEKILEFIRINGPIIPIQIKKALGGELLFIGAVLSELSSQGKVKTTHLKLGGTPFYYLPGQEAMLVKLVKYLNEKDQRTANRLMQEKVLSEKELSPLERVSLQSIKDFAIPIRANEEIFWKWFLVRDEEAELIIRKKLGLKGGEKEKRKEGEKERKTIEEPKEELKIEDKKEMIKEKEEIEEKHEEKGLKYEKEEKLKDNKKRRLTKEEVLNLTKEYLKEKNAEIKEVLSITNSVIDMIVSINTSLGKTLYYCRARFKKNISEGDLASALIVSSSKKLPLLFIAFGKLSKKAKEFCSRELKGAIVVEALKH